jgi:hypothetical protein
MFFDKFAPHKRTLGAKNAALVPAGMSALVESLSGESKGFYWEVQRQQTSKGYRFSVICRLQHAKQPSLEQSDLLEQNERNLGRFVETGQLELSLLKL